MLLLLALRLELVDAPLGLDHRRIADLLVLARTIAPVAVAAAPVAPAAALLALAIAFLARLALLTLAVLLLHLRCRDIRELVELRCFATRHGCLCGLRLSLLGAALRP